MNVSLGISLPENKFNCCLITKKYLKGITSDKVNYIHGDYIKEEFKTFISEESFRQSKNIWVEVKKIFLKDRNSKPFVYYHNNQLLLSEGNMDEELSFTFDKSDEMFYEGNVIVINPLLLQKLFAKYINNEKSIELDEYAHY